MYKLDIVSKNIFVRVQAKMFETPELYGGIPLMKYSSERFLNSKIEKGDKGVAWGSGVAVKG